MGNQNRKATSAEMTRVRRVLREAFPDCDAVFGGRGDYGGHRAPRDHTISFRLRDQRGMFCSNVVWLLPDYLPSVSADDLRAMVGRSNGKRR